MSGVLLVLIPVHSPNAKHEVEGRLMSHLSCLKLLNSLPFHSNLTIQHYSGSTSRLHTVPGTTCLQLSVPRRMYNCSDDHLRTVFKSSHKSVEVRNTIK